MERNALDTFFRINSEVNNIKLAILLTYLLTIQDNNNVAYLIQTATAKKFGIYITSFRKLLKQAQDNGYISISSTVQPAHFFYSEQDFADEYGEDAEQFYNTSTVGTLINLNYKLMALQ